MTGYFQIIEVRYFDRDYLVYRMLKESAKFYKSFYFCQAFASLSMEYVIKSFMNPVTFYQYFWKKLKLNIVFRLLLAND